MLLSSCLRKDLRHFLYHCLRQQEKIYSLYIFVKMLLAIRTGASGFPPKVLSQIGFVVIEIPMEKEPSS